MVCIGLQKYKNNVEKRVFCCHFSMLLLIKEKWTFNVIYCFRRHSLWCCVVKTRLLSVEKTTYKSEKDAVITIFYVCF